MKKSLSKKVTEILFLTSIGVVGYTAVDASTVYAQTINKNVTSEATINQNNKKEEENHILNITEIKYGSIYSEDKEYRIEYVNDKQYEEPVKKYEKSVNEVLVNGKKYSKEENQYSFHYYGMRLDPVGFTEEKNIVVIKASGYKNIELIIQKDGKLLDYKEVEKTLPNQIGDLPKLNIGNSIKVEEGTPIDLKVGVSASDKKDGDLKSKIKFNKGELNYNNPTVGIYQVVYSVTNSLGKTATGTRTIEVIQKKDNNTTGEQNQIEITDKIADGVYTLRFDSYKEDNPTQESMLGGFFDKNIKVTVKDGKITFKMLNLMNADLLYDFRMESKNEFSKSKSEWVGEPDSQGLYFMQTFEFSVEDLLSNHIGCVLVSAMGGKKSDIGNVDKYRKAKFVFDKNLKIGWNGFEVLKNQKTSEDIFNQALKDAGLDRNRDGQVTDEEISNSESEVVLSDSKITDISRLKNLNSNVTVLSLNGNNIHKLPKGIFDNLINLESLYLNGNNIKELPKGIFDKLTKLKTLGLSTNSIQNLPKGIFDKLTNLKQLQLSDNKITEIENGIFDKLSSIESIGLSNNYITRIHDNAFGNLEKLSHIYLYNNKLKNIPRGIGNLKNLKGLVLNNNDISEIPKELSNANNLTELDLHTNYIKEIPKEIYEKLKKLTNLDVSDNQISEIPKNILEYFPNAGNLNFSMNKAKSIPEINSEYVFKTIPQKIKLNLNLEAKAGEITWKQDLSTLDMTYWSFMFGRDIPKSFDEYKNIMKEKKPNKEIKDIIHDRGYDWNIITQIQKKTAQGKYSTIKKIEIKNDNDMNTGSFKDLEMEKGSEYRLVKSVFINQGSMDINVFNDIATTVATSDSIKTMESSKQNNKLYDIKVKILKENEDVQSMATNYIKKVSYEIKDGKHYIIAKLDRSDWMSDIKAEVDGKEISPGILNKEKNPNGEETSNIKFEVKDLSSKIVLGMNVEPMGNARVSFRIVPEEESLKLIKADEAKDENNVKDTSEIKNNDQSEKDKNKESYAKSKLEIEALNKEVEKKKEELEKINKELQKAKEKVENQKNKETDDIKEKNGVYNINADILKENEDVKSMAANYIKKVSYEVKDGKHYIIAKLDRSDWMSDIKVNVDGKEVSPDILNKEKDSKGEGSSDIKFEVKDLSSKIVLGMNVEPMGNARVSFRIVPNKTSVIETSLNHKDKDLKNKLEIEKAKIQLEKVKIEFEKAKIEFETAKLKLKKLKNKKVEEETNKKNSVEKTTSKAKNKLYNIKVKVLKENEDVQSMAANYIKKVSYEIKDGKHYIIAKLDRSDWMNDIKAKVDGKEISPEIINKEKNSDGEETSDIKFKVKDLNSKIVLGMNVEPMGNTRVSFRIVPEEESLKEVKADEAKTLEVKKYLKETNAQHKDKKEKTNSEIDSIKEDQKQNENNATKELNQDVVENNNDNESQFYRREIQGENSSKEGQPLQFLSHKVDMSAFNRSSNSNTRSETPSSTDGFQSLSSLTLSKASDTSEEDKSTDTSNKSEENDSNEEYSELADADSVELEDLGDAKKDEPKVEETKAENIGAEKKTPVNLKVLGIIGASILGLGALIYGLTLKFKNKINKGDNK